MCDYVEIYLTRGYKAKIDRDQWTLCSSYTWCALVTEKGVYAVSRTGGKYIYLHKLLLGFPKELVDHKNRDTLDCRKENLRLVTYSQNNMNKCGNTFSTSRFKGVCYDRSRAKWKARLLYRGTVYLDKRFDTELSAAKAYDDTARRVFGEYAFLNFPEDKC